ncbi:PAS domain-containing protein, partial [Desulfobaculum sp.]
EPSERDQLLDALREHGAVMNLRTRMRRADGTTLTVRQNVREIRDDDGELLYFQGTMTPEPDPGDI